MISVPFPEHSRDSASILEEIHELRRGDLDWRAGRAFSLVYHADEPALESLLHEVAAEFIHENALNPFRYETLLKMETEVTSFACDLFGANYSTMSSGGTESIFLAVQTARDRAQSLGVERPTLVCSNTAHPAFAKACHYLEVERIMLDTDSQGRAIPELYRSAIDERTALAVGSAPNYPFGVIDPIEQLAALAAEREVRFHVDACLGGWLLPFWEAAGGSVPKWGFEVEGVTSMSADIHKYGYCYKGASVVMYRHEDQYRHQIFMYNDWPGGLYASSTAAGTRSGAPIAGAWTVINYLGREGYERLARRVRTATIGFMNAIDAIDGVHVISEPDMSVFAFGSDRYSMDAICDVMDARGWNLDRQQHGLHMMVAPGHDAVVDQFAEDLRYAVEHHGDASEEQHVYGGIIEQPGNE